MTQENRPKFTTRNARSKKTHDGELRQHRWTTLQQTPKPVSKQNRNHRTNIFLDNGSFTRVNTHTHRPQSNETPTHCDHVRTNHEEEEEPVITGDIPVRRRLLDKLFSPEPEKYVTSIDGHIVMFSINNTKSDKKIVEIAGLPRWDFVSYIT